MIPLLVEECLELVNNGHELDRGFFGHRLAELLYFLVLAECGFSFWRCLAATIRNLRGEV